MEVKLYIILDVHFVIRICVDNVIMIVYTLAIQSKRCTYANLNVSVNVINMCEIYHTNLNPAPYLF